VRTLLPRYSVAEDTYRDRQGLTRNVTGQPHGARISS
jgi:hypothetical protein